MLRMGTGGRWCGYEYYVVDEMAKMAGRLDGGDRDGGGGVRTSYATYGREPGFIAETYRIGDVDASAMIHVRQDVFFSSGVCSIINSMGRFG